MTNLTGWAKYVSWRGGRPRFTPGPSMRARGHNPLDLKHADGSWFTREQAAEWSKNFMAALPDHIRKKSKQYTRSRFKNGTNKEAFGFVYFWWAGERIKVGYSANPISRISGQTTSNIDQTRLICALPGSHSDEKRLHKRLAGQRLGGEWFKASPHTIEVIRLELERASFAREPETIRSVE
jgi:Meiotically up-regulated gene 113